MSASLLLLCLTSGALAIRALLSLQLYSGYGTPPMYGDFEAQRHWQEITVNLPMSDWYTNGTDNDLMYWGLDYPPLTAYHSWVNGRIGRQLNESYVALHSSRGITYDAHKTFMRTTVLVIDLLLYIPAILIVIRKIIQQADSNAKTPPATLCYVIALFYPGQILIDNSHFQYNNVSLGLACLAIAAIFGDRNKLAAVFFVLALNYKQMELYHALPFFFYLLAKCFAQESNSGILQTLTTAIRRLISLGLVVVGLFALIWLPWLTSLASALQTLHRIFPVARGVFEDKVSNIWCLINIFYKIKDKFTNEQMAIVCLVCTLIAVLPSCLHLLFNARKTTFVLSLINTSLAFFLFSFQVHEKTILLVTIPIILHFPHEPLMCLWFLQIATFSMLPLLVVDKLVLAFVGTNLIYLLLIRLVSATEISAKDSDNAKWDFLLLIRISANRLLHVVFYASSLLGCTALATCHLFVPAPTRFPHLFPLLISVYSCSHFLLFLCYFNYKQWTCRTGDINEKLHVKNVGQKKKRV